MDSSNSVGPVPASQKPPTAGARSQSGPSKLLKRGLSALAAGNPASAIALLEAALEQNSSPDLAERARVGLVRAHQRQGNVTQAIGYCEPLIHSPSDRTRRWASRALSALRTASGAPAPPEEQSTQGRSSPQPSASNEDSGFAPTGFVPLESTQSASPLEVALQAPAQPPPNVNQSGVNQSGVKQTPRPAAASQPLEQANPARPGGPAGRRRDFDLPWRQTAAAQRWDPLPVRGFEAGICLWTVASLVAIASGLLQVAMALGNPVRRFVDQFVYVSRWRFLEEHPILIVVMGIALLWGLSPWLLQLVLQRGGATRLSFQQATQRSRLSPAAAKLLAAQPHPPNLYALPLRVPLIFSFGLHPRLSWLVISDGVYQLEADQVTALMAAAIAQLRSPLTACLTLTVAAEQLFYSLYRVLAGWGNRQSVAPLRGLAAALSSLAYGLFWLFRWPSLWGGRWRQRQGDRLAVSQTGDPNSYARTLVTLAAALANARRRDPALGIWLQGWASLLPVSPEASLPLGELIKRPMAEAEFYLALQQRLQWSCPPRYRPWLTLNQTHPPLADRLRSLMAVAQRWRLPPEIPEVLDSSSNPPGTRPLSSRDMLLQTAPYWGPLLGASLALLLWSIGGVMGRQSVLGWLWGDRAILYGLVAMGLSMGLLVRVNRYFPEANRLPTAAPESDLMALCTSRAAPVQAVPITLQGRLLGRPGLLNALNQDLLLDTEEGLIRIRFTSFLGPAGNLFLGQPPHRLLGHRVTVTGWFHRGATAWVDASRLQGDRGASAAHHPEWVTLLAVGLALWGAWTIYQGGA